MWILRRSINLTDPSAMHFYTLAITSSQFNQCQKNYHVSEGGVPEVQSD